MSDRTKDILEWVYCIVIAVVLALLIKYFLGTPTLVQQNSMYPTLYSGDRLILSRIVRTANKLPERGDIITFEAPSVQRLDMNNYDPDYPVAIYDDEPTNIFRKFTKYVLEINKTSYIKRVIALPGDYVEIKNGHFYINGEFLKEDYLDSSVRTEVTGALNNFTVPEGYVFAVGDNRSQSNDCRVFGCIPQNKIEGKVKIRFWPFNKFGKIE